MQEEAHSSADIMFSIFQGFYVIRAFLEWFQSAGKNLPTQFCFPWQSWALSALFRISFKKSFSNAKLNSTVFVSSGVVCYTCLFDPRMIVAPFCMGFVLVCIFCDFGYNLGIWITGILEFGNNGVHLTRCGCATRSTVNIFSNHAIHMHFVPRQLYSESILFTGSTVCAEIMDQQTLFSAVWNVTDDLSVPLIIYQLMLYATTIFFSLNNFEQLDNSWKQLTTECECLVVSIPNCYSK